MRLDESGAYLQESNKFVEASYHTSLQIAKNRKAHTYGEELIKPCLLEAVHLILNEESCNKIKQMLLSNDTMQCRSDEMAGDIKEKVTEKLNASPSPHNSVSQLMSASALN